MHYCRMNRVRQLGIVGLIMRIMNQIILYRKVGVQSNDKCKWNLPQPTILSYSIPDASNLGERKVTLYLYTWKHIADNCERSTVRQNSGPFPKLSSSGIRFFPTKREKQCSDRKKKNNGQNQYDHKIISVTYNYILHLWICKNWY